MILEKPYRGEIKMVNKDTTTGIGAELKRLSTMAFSQYEPVVFQIEQGKISDINEIERLLDGIFDFCYDPKMLSLYKRVLKQVVDEHFGIVKRYTDYYLDWYESDGGGNDE